MKWIQKDIKTEFNIVNDPYIKNLKESASQIISHINNKSVIILNTDFDADGLGCAYVWDWFLEQIQYESLIHIPHRRDGYGINCDWIKNNRDVDLIITSDNGVTKVKEVELAKFYGIDILVTDHHLPEEILPNCTVVNPKCGSSEFTKELCGTAIMWYLVRELLLQMNYSSNPMDIIDMVAISTIADMVDMDGANRQIVKAGLAKINSRKFSSKGLELLFQNYDSEIFSDTIAFGVVPILNSASRLEHMDLAFQLLRKGKLENYEYMVDLNNKRKDIQHKFSSLAIETIDNSKNIIIYNNDDIGKGIIGLVASDLMNKFYKPTIVLSDKHGSGRSVDDVHLYNLVFKSENEYITSGGGHKNALGVGVSSYKKFKKELENYCDIHISKEQINPRSYYWKEIFSDEVEYTYDYLNKLRPFGMGNESPSIIIKNQVVKYYNLVGKQQNVLNVTLESGIKLLRFKYGNEWDIKIGDNIDILGKINKNEWNSRITYQIMVEDINGENES